MRGEKAWTYEVSQIRGWLVGFGLAISVFLSFELFLSYASLEQDLPACLGWGVCSPLWDTVAMIEHFALLVRVSTGILFLFWIHRAVANMKALNREASGSPNWAVVWFFVPIVSIFWPFVVAVRLSLGAIKGWMQVFGVILALFWGCSLVVASFLALVTWLIPAEDMFSMELLLGVSRAYSLVEGLLGVFTLLLVFLISVGQANRYKEGINFAKKRSTEVVAEECRHLGQDGNSYCTSCGKKLEQN